MTREDLLDWRQKLLNIVEWRRSLGEFDANSKAILLSLEANLALIEHALEQTKAKK